MEAIWMWCSNTHTHTHSRVNCTLFITGNTFQLYIWRLFHHPPPFFSPLHLLQFHFPHFIQSLILLLRSLPWEEKHWGRKKMRTHNNFITAQYKELKNKNNLLLMWAARLWETLLSKAGSILSPFSNTVTLLHKLQLCDSYSKFHDGYGTLTFSYYIFNNDNKTNKQQTIT